MTTSTFDEAHFWEFCSQLMLSSKDDGYIAFDKPNGCQRYFIRMLAEALQDDRHIVVVLKGRQQGISTIMLALDLYWIFMNPSMEATLIVPDEKLRETFRMNIMSFYESLPVEWKTKLKTDNRNIMAFQMGDGQTAKFVWQIASDRADTKLGKGLGITYMHATEIPIWGVSDDAIANLQASFSTKNPNRLMVYESTAHGYDIFKRLWDSASKSAEQAAIFVPWWLHENYQVIPSDQKQIEVLRTYYGRLETPVWDAMNAEEVELWRRAERMYGFTPTPGHVAWMRREVAEKCGNNLNIFLENFPITETDAFRMTGSQFFPNDMLTEMMDEAEQTEPTLYRVKFGLKLEDTEVLPSTEAFASLRVWEEPAPIAAQYVIGADPAYGSSDWADQFCLSVYRCYSDRMEMVAQFCTPNCTTKYFAWMIAYLAGWYENCLVNLELTGPGQVVLQELDLLKHMQSVVAPDMRKSYASFVRNVAQYRFLRYNGGTSSCNLRHWQTTHGAKWRMFSNLKDLLYVGKIKIHDADTIDELLSIQIEDGVIGGKGREKDDRVIATGLAMQAWIDNLQKRLMQKGMLYEIEQKKQTNPTNKVQRYAVENLMRSRGLVQRH